MDAVLFLILAVVLTVTSMNKPSPGTSKNNEIIKEDTQRTAKLNDAYYEDENAFMEIASALGFPKGV